MKSDAETTEWARRQIAENCRMYVTALELPRFVPNGIWHERIKY